MVNKRLSMPIQDEIQRLKGLRRSQRKVAKILGLDRGTVARYWDEGPDEIEKVVPAWALLIDWEYIKNELKRVPIKILYEEQKEFINLPSYQAFCSYLRNNLEKEPPEVTIKIHRNPGDSIEVDYSGDSIQILNPATGKLFSVELFVGVLSYSGKIYAEFTLSQNLEDFIRAHNNMFFYFGGVSSYIVPDNCKTAVIKADYYNPLINRTYHDMCAHYGMVVDPADKESPRHKPNVEKSISFLQTDFLPRIRNKVFTSLVELNRMLRKWLETANKKPVQGRGQSRDYFFEKEKEYLKALPTIPYELFYFKKAKLHPDCHFQYQRNYYSAPHQYIGKEIDIKYNSRLVHAYYNCERIATHKCMKGTYHWSTDPAHYPEKKHIEFNYHLAQLKKKSNLIGQNTRMLINRIIDESRYPLKVIRKAQGILNLEKQFGRDALNYACGEAMEFNKMNVDNVKRFAKYFKHKPKEELTAPKRQIELVCLQGGYSERNN